MSVQLTSSINFYLSSSLLMSIFCVLPNSVNDVNTSSELFYVAIPQFQANFSGVLNVDKLSKVISYSLIHAPPMMGKSPLRNTDATLITKVSNPAIYTGYNISMILWQININTCVILNNAHFMTINESFQKSGL